MQRCKSISALKIPKIIKRSDEVPANPDEVFLKYRVEYSRSNDSGVFYCEDVLAMKLVRRGRWIMDWHNMVASNCPQSESGQAPQPSAVPPPKPVARVKAKIITSSPPPQAEPTPPPVATEQAEKSPWWSIWPADNSPAEPSTPTMPTTVKLGHSDHLLGLWSPEDLLGQPGDERIIGVRPPDISPPQRREPKDRLPEIQGKLADSIRRVRLPEGKKLVALTFDLCEQADDRTGYDRQIVNYLRQQKLPATFFAGGKWLRSHEDKALQLMADPLFEIGNHGWTHGNLRVMRGQRMLDQIVWTQAEYNRLWDVLDRKAKTAGLENAMRAIPRQPQTLRFPYGTCDATSLHAANQLGLSAIQWDVVSGDAAPKTTPDAVARAVLAGVKPGSIVVFHANGRGHGTAGALPRIVESLRTKGYEFATVSNLLRAGEPDAVSQCYEMRPGDNLYIDAKFGEGTGER